MLPTTRRSANCLQRPPRGQLLIRYLAGRHEFRGIGFAKASALWKEFGEALYDILQGGKAEILASVIGAAAADDLIRAWAEKQAEVKVIEWLDRHGFNFHLAQKIIKVWGTEAVTKLADNPYRMLAFAPWGQVDRAALGLAVRHDDARRYVAAVESVCYSRLDEKHTVTPHKLLVGSATRLLRCTEEEAARAVELAKTEHAIIESPGGWQPFGPAVMEQYIAERFQSLAEGTAGGQRNLFWREPSGGELNSVFSDLESREGIILTDEQRESVYVALKNSISVLTGGAGVGKTTALKTLHEAAERVGRCVVQMALSGRAARQLRDTTGREALTIAAFLNAVRNGQLRLADESTLIIVDESSMLDLPTAYRILRAIPPRCGLMFVGDPYQLPPIGFGLVFHILPRCKSIPCVELKQVHRQAESTGIPDIANSIRVGRVPTIGPFNGKSPGVSFIDADPGDILDVLIDIVEQLGGMQEVQIIAPTKQGAAGVNLINETFHELFCVGRRRLEGYPFAEGDPVIHLVNDYPRDLSNGSIGVVTTGPLHDQLVVDFGHIREPLTRQLAENLALAYAITVHKAQGSQFRRVIMPVVQNSLLDRTLVYTAVTRGVDQVVLVGQRHSFQKAVSNPPYAHERQTGLKRVLTVLG